MKKQKKIYSIQRIGPHNFNILCIIIGALLGDAHAEFRLSSNGTRISFCKEHHNKAYLLWLWNFFKNEGYCSSKKPNIKKRIGLKSKKCYIIRFHTYTFSSFNWILNTFYKKTIKNKTIKIIPNFDFLNLYLTPIALAIWIMNDGTKSGKNLKFCINCFTKSEVIFLVNFLKTKYKLKCSINSVGDILHPQFVIYILQESIPELKNIVKSFIHPSMKYKLA